METKIDEKLFEEYRLKAEAWDRLFGEDEERKSSLLAREVQLPFARKCRDEHSRLFKGNPQDVIDACTSWVAFGGVGLTEWLIKVGTSVDFTDLRVVFSAYTDDSLALLTGDYEAARDEARAVMGNKKSRFTALLWPYKGDLPATYFKGNKNGEECLPYNLGHINP